MTRHQHARLAVSLRTAGAALLGVSLLGSPALAQSDADTLAAVRDCNQIEDDAARLSCIDTALSASATEASVPAARPESEAPAEPADRIEATTSAEGTPAAAEPGERPVRIVEIRTNRLGVTRFTTASGEVWVQRSAADGRYPPVPFDTVLLPAMRDSYFLVSPLGGPRVRVSEAR